jgi:NADPH:quinone reductase
VATAREVFDIIRQGKVKVEVRHIYPLADAERVHRDLESRRTVGSIVMVP